MSEKQNPVITVMCNDNLFGYAHAYCPFVAMLPDGSTVTLPAGTVLRETTKDGRHVMNEKTPADDIAHVASGTLDATSAATFEPTAAADGLPRYQARAQRPDGLFEKVGDLSTFREAKKLALAAQEKRGGPVHVVDEGSEAVWSSEIDAVIFEPTAEEIDGCASLAKLTGLPMRALVIALSHQLASFRLTRDELSKANSERASLDLARAAPQRLRVGPWVKVKDPYTGGASERRHNMFGGSAGNIAETSNGWVWFVAVPFAAPEEGGDGDGLSRDQARAIVDAKLRKNFDLATDPAKETP